MSGKKFIINLMLETKALITHVKFRKNSSIASLFITDFSESIRVLFDFDTKKVLKSNAITISAADEKAIAAAILKSIEKDKIDEKKKKEAKEKAKKVQNKKSSAIKEDAIA